MQQVHRGDIFYADLSPVVGSEQGGVRPVLVIQNEMGNRHSPTVICAAITSRMHKSKLPTHVEIDARRYGVVKNSVVLLEQIRTIDKQRLKESVCHLDQEIMQKGHSQKRGSGSSQGGRTRRKYPRDGIQNDPQRVFFHGSGRKRCYDPPEKYCGIKL